MQAGVAQLCERSQDGIGGGWRGQPVLAAAPMSSGLLYHAPFLWIKTLATVPL